MRLASTLIIFLLMCSGCTEQTKAEDNNAPDSRFIIVFDLSNRLHSTPKPSDLDILKIILKNFHSIVKSKGRIFSDDDLFVIGLNDEMRHTDSITIQSNNAVEIDAHIQSKTLQISDKFKSIYANSNQKSTGSDIWSFMNNDLDNMLSCSQQKTNKLIIVTDGYLFSKKTKLQSDGKTTLIKTSAIAQFSNNPQWMDAIKKSNYGIVPAKTAQCQYEALILELSSNNNGPYESDVLSNIWEKWIKKSGANRVKALKSNSSKQVLESIIADYMFTSQ